MAGIPHCCTPASLIMLIILALFPMKSWSTDESYKSQKDANKNAILKRFHELDDSFMGLMGRRSAAPARSSIENILVELLRQRTKVVCQSAQKCLQKEERFINHRE